MKELVWSELSLLQDSLLFARPITVHQSGARLAKPESCETSADFCQNPQLRAVGHRVLRSDFRQNPQLV